MNTTELELAGFLQNYLYVPSVEEFSLYKDNLELGHKVETLTIKVQGNLDNSEDFKDSLEAIVI